MLTTSAITSCRSSFCATSEAPRRLVWNSFLDQSGNWCSDPVNYGDEILDVSVSSGLTLAAYRIRADGGGANEEFGKDFTERNLRAMRQFYEIFPIRHAVRAHWHGRIAAC